MDDAYGLTVDDHTAVVVEQRPGYWPNAPVSKHWWLVVDGRPVAYLHTLSWSSESVSMYGTEFVLCDIEVREAFRGQGLSRTIVRLAEKIEGHTLHTTGGYTPKGAAALMGRLPVIKGYEAGVKFSDMPFVLKWDNFVPINRL